MPELFYFFIAIFPLIVLFLLVLAFRFSLFYASLYSFLLMLYITLMFWQTPFFAILASLIKSFYSTFEIFFIIFGALSLNYVLEHTSLMKTIKLVICKSSKDKTLSALVIAWFFVAFIEGIAGFGLPAVLAAPLLITLGLSPFTSVILALLGDSVAVSYGAVGVPINKGILLSIDSTSLSSYLKISIYQLATNIALQNALYHIILSSFVPLIMVFLIQKDLKGNYKKISSYLVPSLIAGFTLTIFMYLTIYFIDSSLASILGSLASLSVFLFLYERVFLLNLLRNKIKGLDEKEVFIAFSPYILLVLLLLFFKLPISYINKVLDLFLIKINTLKGYNLNIQFNFLKSPGFSFILVTFIFWIYLKASFSLKKIFISSFKRTYKSFVTLFFVISLVQLMIYSAYGKPFFTEESILGLTSINFFSLVGVLSKKIPFGDSLYYFLPGFLGLLGASLAGSATVSNILFSNISVLAVSPIKSLALQNIGASLGNLTSLYNIFVVSSVVGLVGLEFKILKKTIPFAIAFYLLASLLFIVL